MKMLYLRNSDGCIINYAINSESSFNRGTIWFNFNFSFSFNLIFFLIQCSPSLTELHRSYKKFLNFFFSFFNSLEKKDTNRMPSVFLLTGNKKDLEDQQEVPQSQVAVWANLRGISFIEVSAKAGENIDTALFGKYNFPFSHCLTTFHLRQPLHGWFIGKKWPTARKLRAGACCVRHQEKSL